MSNAAKSATLLSKMFPARPDTPRNLSKLDEHHVVVFGESGVGKSSLVNLIIGSSVAKTSPDAEACTLCHERHDVLINGHEFKIWDTAGLDGGSFSVIRSAVAERKLKKLLKRMMKDGRLALLVYCVRGSRATQALVRHYRTFSSVTCKSNVPVVIVVTALESLSGEMDNWWQRNREKLATYGMTFADHVCVTTLPNYPGDPIELQERCRQSQQAVRDLVYRNCAARPPRNGEASGEHTGGRNGSTDSVQPGQKLSLLTSIVSFMSSKRR
ncbi:P-loop containing nucleoside triphosphate hydrolase protein [Phlebopus sp. FC_14]|nr:P-loop containing nucleoside triphosphate hydrolase protein [Phlebopus sp. FC_14]